MKTGDVVITPEGKEGIVSRFGKSKWVDVRLVCVDFKDPKPHYKIYLEDELKVKGGKEMKTGIELIAEERQEQIEKHGFTTQHDVDEHDSEELRLVAVRALTIGDESNKAGHYTARYIDCDWGDTEDYICRKPYKERLIIAGALIAAEIDRIQREE